ncbi:hypothetical protein JST56_06285 [Candidatus Dependentiae bacterium]|nr:hypothetical protein [Candidatus Dependentiae bacterium]
MVKRIIALLIICISSVSFVLPELVIGKHVHGDFAPLEDSDQELFKSAHKILTTYQWPMCLAHIHEFSQQEQELLFSSQPYAEETFIRNKLQELDKILDVIFVPTTLYELFCYLTFFKNSKDSIVHNSAQVIQEKFLLGEFDELYYQSIARKPLVEERRLSFAFYAAFNELSAVCDFAFGAHQQLASFLINHVGGCAQPPTSGKFSKKIEQQSASLAQEIITELVSVSASDYNFQKLKKELDRTKKFKRDGMVAKALELEYKARKHNRMLLWRGTEGVSQCIKALAPASKLKSLSKQLLDSALRAQSLQDFVTLIRAQAEKAFQPFSLSYGNSLFAAFLYDCGACSYYYAYSSKFGYALELKKSSYIKHQCHDTLLVSPLGTIVSLFAGGALFHSRSKACASPSREEGPVHVQGIFGGVDVDDAQNFLVIRKDPLMHAFHLSKLIAKNAHIFKLNCDQGEVEEVKKSHRDASHFYRHLGLYKDVLGEIKQHAIAAQAV